MCSFSGSDFQQSKGCGPKGHGPEADRTVLKGFDVVLYLSSVGSRGREYPQGGGER